MNGIWPRVGKPLFSPHLHALDTSGTVIQTGTHVPDTLVQANSCGEGTICSVSILVVQIPTWYIAHRTCCSRAFRVGGSLSMDRFLRQKSSCLVSLMLLVLLLVSYSMTINLSSVANRSESSCRA